jgi:hypothetical protein
MIGRVLKDLLIGNHYLGTVLKHLMQGLGSIPCLGDHFHVGLIFEQAPQPLAQQDMAVHQNAPNFSTVKRAFALNLCVGEHTCSL